MKQTNLPVAKSTLVLSMLGLIFYLAGCATETEPAQSSLDSPLPTATAVQVAIVNTEAPIQATLPPPILEEIPTNTPLPATDTPTPTETPIPTDTPTPTNTPIPATNTPIPPPPTNTPIPVPPTDTPIPPPPGVNGIVGNYLNLLPDSSYSAGGRIWFEFSVSNITGSPIPYNVLGVMPRKDGQDRVDWFQMSYGGSNSTLKPEGLTWKDNIKMRESGNYTLRLAVCFDGVDTCRNGGGTFHTLSPEIPVTIN